MQIFIVDNQTLLKLKENINAKELPATLSFPVFFSRIEI
jgi:hypothetical protein